MKRIAIFASGTGSNALRILEHLQGHASIEVGLIISNKTTAPVLNTAKRFGVPTLLLQRTPFYNTTLLLDDLQTHAIDFIVLAGFLWLIPPYLVKAFPKKMVNIHPALLPKYGGKGMYGKHVHQAVYDAKEQESGITIHYVNEKYDEGAIVFQAKCMLSEADMPIDIARKVLELEHFHYPKVVESLLINK